MGDIHFETRGPEDGPVFLLLHAFPLSSGMWEAQMEGLAAAGVRVVAPDARGLGKSKAPPEALTMDVIADDALGVLAQLGVKRAVVAGLSMGGYASFALFRKRPELVRGLVLADTRATPDNEEGKGNREKFAQNALTKGLGWVAAEMTPKLLSPAAPKSVVERVRALIEAGTPEGVAAAQRGMAKRPDSTPDLAAIACPTLILCGTEDKLTPPSDSEKLQAAIRGSRLVLLEEAGHLSNLEQPAAFTAALIAFAAGLGRTG